MKKAILFSALAIFLLQAHPALARQSCRVCGMYLDVYQKTATRLVDHDGHEAGTCGVACLLRMVSDAGGPDAWSSIQVRDFTSGQLIDAAGASFVIGSDTIPDMLPNIIAFADKEKAASFAAEHGGAVIGFSQALLSISPMGMTMPSRLNPAVLPGKGATMVGLGHMKMVMDEVALGSGSVDPLDFARRPMQMMGPKEMSSEADMFMAAHSISDRDNIAIKIANFKKEMEMYTMGGMAVSTTKNSGIGDIEVSLRHLLWKDTFYSHFLSLLGAITLPSGDFDSALIGSPGLQIGTGAFTGTAGILYSQRMGDFWFHSSLSYKYALENSDDYQFGDVTSLAAALHYTPNYDLIFGLEVDGSQYGKNEYRGVKQDNTGGFRSFATAIANWKFLTAMGGNFSVKATYGMPLYEDMNHYKSGMMEKAQMGGGYMSSIGLSFSRRLAY